MAEEKKIMTPDEESNVDEINQFVAGSENEYTYTNEDDGLEQYDGAEEKPVVPYVEKKAPEEKSVEKESKSVTEHKKSTQKSHPKTVKAVTDQDTPKKTEHKIEHKKPEPKPEKKVTEHKAQSIHKKMASTKDKTEKIKDSPKPKKVSRVVKENRRDDKPRSRKNSKNMLLWIGIGLLAVILIIALVWLLWPNQKQSSAENQTTNTVAATVNGEAIYLQDIITQYNNLDQLSQQIYSVESLLNNSIENLLLFQESKNLGIKIPKDMIQSEIDTLTSQNGLTEKQLEEALAEQGMTIDDAKELIEKNLAIRELLNRTILQDINITETQISNYYELNKEKFNVPERVTVRHILVLVTEDVSNESAKAKIDKISSELTDNNFCELAANYSEDPGSKDNCGEYTFAKGDFNNPEFENPSFDLKIGEKAIIQTSFGYHLIKKMAEMPAGIKELSEVYEEINYSIYNEVAQENFDKLMDKLWNNSIIVNYYTKEPVADDTDTVLVPLENLDDFAKCLTENNVTMYGAYWCPHCENQKEMFGDSVKYINYIECAVEGQPQVQTKACTEAGVSGYPTWIINDKQYPGEQTLDRLAQLTGCTISQ